MRSGRRRTHSGMSNGRKVQKPGPPLCQLLRLLPRLGRSPPVSAWYLRRRAHIRSVLPHGVHKAPDPVENQEDAPNDTSQSHPPEPCTRREEILLLGLRAPSPTDRRPDHAKTDTGRPGTEEKHGRAKDKFRGGGSHPSALINAKKSPPALRASHYKLPDSYSQGPSCV
jgi:hypothetical protein